MRTPRSPTSGQFSTRRPRGCGRHARRRCRYGRGRPVWLLVHLLCAVLACVVAMLLLGGPASAATSSATVRVSGGSPMLAVYDLPTVVNNATRWMVGILATLATFFLTLGGARYLVSGGDPSEVERAKGSFKNAAVGYALAVMAPVILHILQTILGV